MSGRIVLLVTENPALIAHADKARPGLRGMRIERCAGEEEAHLGLQRNAVAIVLLHLTSTNTRMVLRLLTLLRAVHAKVIPLVLCDDDCMEWESTVRQAGAAGSSPLPDDARGLADIVDEWADSSDAYSDSGAWDSAAATSCVAPEHDPLFGVHSSVMVELTTQVRRVATQDTTLLFTGETGTGKTRMARLVHELSPRRAEPFTVIDCGSLSPTLIESEMFGHIKGAFTGADRDRPGKFAAAGRGTLLLDEINSLPLALQSKLLRVVDDRMFEPVGSNKAQPLQARVIAISNVPLDREVEAGRFRGDLFYRLNVVGFYLPPLRDRRRAIAPLVSQFLSEFAARNRPDVCGLSASAMQALEGYGWPGNVRELRNVIERAVALAAGPEVQLRDLPETMRTRVASVSSNIPMIAESTRLPVITLAENREETEIRHIRDALQRHRNNRRRAAAELGISRMGLYKKLHKYGLMESPTTVSSVASAS